MSERVSEEAKGVEGGAASDATKQLGCRVVNHLADTLRRLEVVHNPVADTGYTTNLIEAKWSQLKRWCRRRNGGKLPNHGSRRKWKRLISEFQWRKFVSSGLRLDRLPKNDPRHADMIEHTFALLAAKE